MVHHHVKYKEIHGVDEIILISEREHRRIHNRLRREGACKIPPKELAVISDMAYKRSDKRVNYLKNYQRTEEGKAKNREYTKNNLRQLQFSDKLGEKTHLIETYSYNLITNNLCISTRFVFT